MEDYNIFAERLKKILSEKMTQRELAEKTGYTEVTISRYANGQRVPRGTEIVKIAQALNVSCDYLLGVVDNENKISDEENLCAIKEVIKKCPFCGSSAEIGYASEHNKLFVIGCNTEMCIGNINHFAMVFVSKESAIKAWNKRKEPIPKGKMQV